MSKASARPVSLVVVGAIVWGSIWGIYSGEESAPADPPAVPGIKDALQKKVSFAFDQTPVQQVAEFLHEVTGVNYVLDAGGAAEEPITARLRDVRLDLALRLTLKQAGLAYVAEEHAVYISTPERVELVGRGEKPLEPADDDMAEALAKPLAFRFDGTPLRTVAEFLAAVAGVNIVTDIEGEEPMVTMDCAGLPLSEALKYAARLTRAQVYCDGNVIVITNRLEPAPTAATVEPGSENTAEILEKRITVQFDGTPLSQVSEFLSEVTKLNYVCVIRGDDPPVALRLKDVRLADALTQTCRVSLTRGLLDGTIFVFTDQRDLRKPPRRLVTEDEELEAALETPISFTFQAAPVGNVAEFVAEVTGVNVVKLAERDPPVTLRLKDVPLAQALQYVALVSDMNVHCEGNVVVFEDKPTQEPGRPGGE